MLPLVILIRGELFHYILEKQQRASNKCRAVPRYFSGFHTNLVVWISIFGEIYHVILSIQITNVAKIVACRRANVPIYYLNQWSLMVRQQISMTFELQRGQCAWRKINLKKETRDQVLSVETRCMQWWSQVTGSLILFSLFVLKISFYFTCQKYSLINLTEFDFCTMKWATEKTCFSGG